MKCSLVSESELITEKLNDRVPEGSTRGIKRFYQSLIGLCYSFYCVLLAVGLRVISLFGSSVWRSEVLAQIDAIRLPPRVRSAAENLAGRAPIQPVQKEFTPQRPYTMHKSPLELKTPTPKLPPSSMQEKLRGVHFQRAVGGLLHVAGSSCSKQAHILHVRRLLEGPIELL